MDFYVSWYHGDPAYQVYDSECDMLISPTSVSGRWTLREFPKPPRRLMIDSGGYRYMIAGGRLPSPRQVFEAQLRIMGKIQMPTVLCALDHPMAESGLDSNELDRRITRTIANAYEFRLLVDLYDLDKEVESLAIVQGYDPASIAHCAQELKAMGFQVYGIGSLAGLQMYEQVLDRVRAAVAVVGKGVHVFGVSSIRTIRALKRIGVSSIDSSRPAKSAAYNELLYARPFRRFGILVDGQPTGTIRRNRCIAKPLPCECPVCQQSSQDIMKVGKREFIRFRAVHNYYQMKWAIVEAPIRPRSHTPNGSAYLAL